MCYRKRPQTRAHASPVGRCKSHQSRPEGTGPWDPGGGPAGERILNSKRPTEAMDIAPGIDAHNKSDTAGIDTCNNNKENLVATKTSQRPHPTTSTTNQRRTFTPLPSPHPTVEESTRFSFRGPYRGRGVVLGDVEAEPVRLAQHIATRPFGHRHTRVTRSHAHPRAFHT